MKPTAEQYIRFVWAAAVPLAASLTGALGPELAAVVVGWVALSALLRAFGPEAPWLFTALDFAFATLTVALTPLWWTLVVGGVLAAMRHGVLAGLIFPSAGVTLLMAVGFLSGAIVPEDLADLGRALLALLVLTPVAAWVGARLGGEAETHAEPEERPQAAGEPPFDTAALQYQLDEAQALIGALEQERDRATEVEEETRRMLARSLHDGPTQTIAAIAMRLNYAGRLVERDREAAQVEIRVLEDLARQTTKEIRHMLFTLRPLILETKGLEAALHQLARKMDETHGRLVQIETEPAAAEGLDMAKQAAIFFIADEAINNAYKHAEAATIRVALNRNSGEQVVLLVEDDGVGFNVGAVDANYEQRGSLGMVNMRERSELIDGVLYIESAEGEGTRIRLEVPLNS